MRSFCVAALALSLGCPAATAGEEPDDGTLPYEPFNGGVQTGDEAPAEAESSDGGCAANAPEERLACHFAERARTEMPDADVTIVSVDLVRVDDQEVALDTLRAICDRDPDSCVERMNDWITSMAAARIAERTPARAEQLRPILKHREFVEAVGEQLPAVAALARPFVGDVYVVLVVDFPRVTRGIDGDDLETLGMSAEEAHARALRNLREHHGDLPVEAMPNGLRALGPTDGYAAARLLLHDRWASVAEAVEGDLLVAPCNRDLVIVGGSDPTMVEALREASIRAYRYVDHPITDALWRWTPEGWVTFEEENVEDPGDADQRT